MLTPAQGDHKVPLDCNNIIVIEAYNVLHVCLGAPVSVLQHLQECDHSFRSSVVDLLSNLFKDKAQPPTVRRAYLLHDLSCWRSRAASLNAP